MKTLAKLTVSVTSLILPLLLPACSSEIKNYPSLVNQGMLGLSTNNPYLGANLFLSSEFEKSSYLFNFFKNRGAPTAIELIEKDFKSPHLILYYPSEREVYAADLLERKFNDGQKSHEWVVRGPYSIERQDFRDLTRLEAAMSGEPVFLVGGKPFRFRFQHESEQVAKVLKPNLPEYVVPTPTPKPTPKKKPKIIVVKKDDKPIEVKPPEDTVSFKGLSSDQMGLLMAKGYARRASNGDIVHIVKSEKESLDEIIKWYTGSIDAKGEVLKASSLSIDSQLTVGTKVIIPEAAVKQPKAMPAPPA